MAEEAVERVEVRAVSMYAKEWEILDSYARRRGFSRSLALRQILREWEQDRRADVPPGEGKLERAIHAERGMLAEIPR
jgi:hypothetical protein